MDNPLHLALKNYNLLEVIHLIKDKTFLNAKNAQGKTPLHLAIFDCQWNSYIIKEFIEHGAICVPKCNERGQVPIHLAISNGCLDVVKHLLKQGADLDIKDEAGTLPLYLAVSKSNLNIIQELVRYGATVNDKNQYGFTPLHNAVEKGNLEVVQLLLRNGAMPNEKDNDGFSPLCLALSKHNWNAEIIQELLKHGTYYSEMDENNDPPLHLAIDKGTLNIVELLLESGANANIRDYDNITPLNLAVYKLIWIGKKHQLQNKQQNPSSIEDMHFQIIRRLLEFGANVHSSYIDLNEVPKQVAEEIIKYGISEQCNESDCKFCNSVTDQHNQFVYQCKSEIEIMRKHIIVGESTLYDFIVLKKDYGREFVNTQDILDNPTNVLTKYQIYGDIILNILETKLYIFKKFCDNPLIIKMGQNKLCINSDCIKEIGKYLSKKNLKNFVKAILQ